MTPDQQLRAIADNLYGYSATDEDLELLKSRFPVALRPNWLMTLIGEHRLGGVHFSLGKDYDRSGLGAEIMWLTPKQIVSEVFDSEPGLSVASYGFFPIGACATGSGDPYFLDLRNGSSGPPVVRIPHEYASCEPYPLERIEVIAQSLSEFFNNARALRAKA